MEEVEKKEQMDLKEWRGLSRSSSSVSDEEVILDRSSYDLVMEEVVDLRAMLLKLRRVLLMVRTPLGTNKKPQIDIAHKHKLNEHKPTVVQMLIDSFSTERSTLT